MHTRLYKRQQARDKLHLLLKALKTVGVVLHCCDKHIDPLLKGKVVARLTQKVNRRLIGLERLKLCHHNIGILTTLWRHILKGNRTPYLAIL